MNTPPEAPPVISPNRAIAYDLTRWDLLANWMTILFRNRLLQVFVLVALVINGCLTLGPGWWTRPVAETVVAGVVFLLLFAGFLTACQLAFGLVSSFLLKQRGVVGRHTLEITEQGLVERTDFNETLHKWASIGRICSVFGYLYIYVSDMNSHQVPKRGFDPGQIADFVAEVRARSSRARSA